MRRNCQKPVRSSGNNSADEAYNKDRQKFTSGTVTLVGAGPGDAELLTLKAVRALQAADIILFDHLVSDDVLDLARNTAKRILVGKRARQPSCRQEDINALMIKLARQGKHVVRLKSGDPMVFGRAGEEIAELRQHGISVKVVPGITAASAMASRLNISLTHRDQAHSVRFVTGHSRKGQLPDDLDWKGLADAETTLIFYMGGQTAAEIAKRLTREGLAADTPVVVMAAVSRDNETLWHGTLSEIAAEMHLADEALSASVKPVLIGVGAVFRDVKHEQQVTTDAAEYMQSMAI